MYIQESGNGVDLCNRRTSDLAIDTSTKIFGPGPMTVHIDFLSNEGQWQGRSLADPEISKGGDPPQSDIPKMRWGPPHVGRGTGGLRRRS